MDALIGSLVVLLGRWLEGVVVGRADCRGKAIGGMVGCLVPEIAGRVDYQVKEIGEMVGCRVQGTAEVAGYLGRDNEENRVFWESRAVQENSRGWAHSRVVENSSGLACMYDNRSNRGSSGDDDVDSVYSGGDADGNGGDGDGDYLVCRNRYAVQQIGPLDT
jgi:hypothetical protein